MTQPRYTAWTRHLHWIVFLLLVLVFACGYGHSAAERGSDLRANLKWAHVQFGVAVFLTMIARVVTRLRHRGEEPKITPPIASWQARLASLVHGALYVLLLAVPVLGVTMMVLKARPWTILGVPMPTLAEANRPLAERVEMMHENLGGLILALSLVHIVVALYHHLVRKDDALRRMLPR